MNNVKKLYCSFCGKSQDEVERLIAGPNVFICNECVRLCVKILDEPPPSPEQVQARKADDVALQGSLAETVKKIITKGKERGYITFDELNKLLPAGEFTSEQIDETMAMLVDIGINLIEDKADIELYLPLAEKGDARAQFWLGHSYEALKNYTEAFKWYKKSAEQGEIWDDGCSAQYQLGAMYKWGKGVKQSDEEAYFWFLVAEGCGYRPADDANLAKNFTLEKMAAIIERAEDWIKAHPASAAAMEKK